MKKRIRTWLPIAFAVYLVLFRFVIEPHSDANWFTYTLVDELRIFVIVFSLVVTLLCIRNWRFMLIWMGLTGASVLAVGHPAWGNRPVVSGKTIKVLTYNVAGFEINKPGVLKVLKESNADIICLQEACKIGTIKVAGETLSKEMGGYYWSGASTNLILSRYPLVEELAINVPTKWPTKEFPVAVVESPLAGF